MYVILFFSTGGSSVPYMTGVVEGSTINLPVPVRGGYIFAGWFRDDHIFEEPFTSSTKVTGDVWLYAKWELGPFTNGVLPEGTLNEKLRTIAERVDANVIYDIAISEDTVCQPVLLDTKGINVIIKIRSASKADIKKLTLNAPANMFLVNSNVTLVLEDIIIQGRNDNEYPMIGINGTVELLSGAKITGNTNNESTGGAVLIAAGGKMIIDGGEISDNHAVHPNYGDGGAVFIDSISDGGGSLHLKSGTIANNSARWGGGVCVNQRAEFIMNGGSIVNNTAVAGGGVFIKIAVFEKTNSFGSYTSGVISGNTATGTKTYSSHTAQVVYWDGYFVNWSGGIHYRGNNLDEYTGITTKNWNSPPWEGDCRMNEAL